MSADLLTALDALGTPRVLVVGDVMLDRYVWGDAERISQEAPVILLRADRREERLGGASSVATMLRALECEVALVGVIGADAAARDVERLFVEQGIGHDCVLPDSDRPTTVKERYVGRAQHRHPQQMIRVDYETRAPLSAALEDRLRGALLDRLDWCDIVLVSDYDKGVCTPGLLRAVIVESARRGKRVLVDPIRCRPDTQPHAWAKYRGSAALTPNRLEASLASGLSIQTQAEALAAGAHLQAAFDLEAAIVTLDRDGMALVSRDGQRGVFPTRPRQVYDITGAGDMVLSVLGLALAAQLPYDLAIRLANVAGGLEVEKIGVAPVSRAEMRRDLLEHQSTVPSSGHKLLPLEALLPELERRRARGCRIVFTNGCFDVLHAGHVQYLHEARAQGDVLVVGLNADASVRRLKGPQRPINRGEDRALVLGSLADVDYVTLFTEDTPLRLIQAIRPDVLVKGADYRKENVVGAELVEAAGGRVHLAAMRAGLSTSQTLEKLHGGGDSDKSSLKQVA
ncbi:MAG TPA: D-glycero-beta-D-manno-heptose 1-phosphate adenylyltransferase [Gemmatales bacterium]|nr:D-glycero-beta-D-manno-heptose 1-phosphate adenylyltransferase [Gemmatales bacterium]HMP60438.1 D-glycero-beta-D-manno-heptose 1-phosphate adenylyltransferase [Gemmatales bacterium]